MCFARYMVTNAILLWFALCYSFSLLWFCLCRTSNNTRQASFFIKIFFVRTEYKVLPQPILPHYSGKQHTSKHKRARTLRFVLVGLFTTTQLFHLIYSCPFNAFISLDHLSIYPYPVAPMPFAPHDYSRSSLGSIQTYATGRAQQALLIAFWC